MPLTGIEPGTFQSADRCSTTEPNRFWQKIQFSGTIDKGSNLSSATDTWMGYLSGQQTAALEPHAALWPLEFLAKASLKVP